MLTLFSPWAFSRLQAEKAAHVGIEKAIALGVVSLPAFSSAMIGLDRVYHSCLVRRRWSER